MMGPDSGMASSEPTASPKEAFRLGGDPPKVARLSRKSLAVVGVVAGLGIGSALLIALRSPDKETGHEIYGTDSRAKAEVISSAPKDYSQIPKLGPPLPGDLGKPILSAQQEGRDIAVPRQAHADAVPGNAGIGDRDRRQQELAAARASQLFLSGNADQPAPVISPIDASQDLLAAPNLADPGQSAAGAQTPGAARLSFLRGGDDTRSLASASIEPPASPNILQAGNIIPAALITGIRSDLPGQISAQVTQNVYDSPTGRILLIPQGARLIGEYDSGIDAGQTRILMAWTRLILPDGSSIQLERQPGADAGGFAGLQDMVDNHWGGVARAAAISTLMGIGTELAAGSDADLIRALRRASQDTINQAGQQIVQRQLAIRPTLTIRPGHPLRIVLTRDLVLPVWGKK